MKKIGTILLIIFIVCGWVVTVADVNPGPLAKDLKLGLDLKGGVYVVLEAETLATGAELEELMSKTQDVIERRVNSLGLSEPNVIKEGTNRIRVEMPGVTDAEEATLGTDPLLVDTDSDGVNDNVDLFPTDAEEAIKAIGTTAQLEFQSVLTDKVITGDMIKDTGMEIDQKDPRFYTVTLEFNSEGAALFEEMTALASQYYPSDESRIYIMLDGEVVSAPVVQEKLTGGKAVITGKYSADEAKKTAAIIREGALPVDLVEMETSVIGPTLGEDSLSKSVFSAAIGIVLILLFMIAYYRLPGIAASIALSLYILIVFWILIALKAVITLPGIAGMILSIGMAVDANVIIFERIKEEIKNGLTIRVAVNKGFNRALRTILDANITTLIAGVVLYQFGSGPVKGFAVTLMIGILVSLLTAVIVTRFLLSTFESFGAFSKKKYFGIKEV